MTEPLGLRQQEVDARLARGEGNTVPRSGRTYRQIIVENVFTFVNGVLFALGLALVLVGRPLDAALSSGVVIYNILVGVVQEVRAKRILDRIALLSRSKVAVRRDGRLREVESEQIVVGDVISLGAGDQVVVDGRLLEGRV